MWNFVDLLNASTSVWRAVVIVMTVVFIGVLYYLYDETTILRTQNAKQDIQIVNIEARQDQIPENTNKIKQLEVAIQDIHSKVAVMANTQGFHTKSLNDISNTVNDIRRYLRDER